MSKNCAFCGKALGKFSSPVEIPGTDYIYCDAHSSYRMRLYNALLENSDTDLSQITLDFESSLKSKADTFSEASDALIAYLQKRINEDEKIQKTKAAREAEAQELREQARQKEEAELIYQKYAAIAKTMLQTTTHGFDGYKITKYHDVLFDEVIIGKGFLNIITSTFDNLGAALSGSEASVMTNRLNEIKSIVKERVKIKAAKLGANALVGIDFESSFAGGDLIMVSMTATAVTVEPISD